MAERPSRWADITCADGSLRRVNHRACLRGSMWQRYWYRVVAYYISRARYWHREAEAWKYITSGLSGSIELPQIHTSIPQQGPLLTGYRCTACGLVVSVTECPTWPCSCGRQGSLGWERVEYSTRIATGNHT